MCSTSDHDPSDYVCHCVHGAYGKNCDKRMLTLLTIHQLWWPKMSEGHLMEIYNLIFFYDLP